ncbi:MAG: potassium channel family protein, partial [Actinomycetales bacterium]
LSQHDPRAFTEQLDAFSGYYFSLTVLATVGFGDITPVTTLARSFTMVQMAIDLALIGILVRIVSTAANRAMVRRQASQNTQNP